MSAEVLCGDCRVLMRAMPAASVDMVLTDPPYGITSLVWDQRVDGWLDEVARVLKPSGSLWVFGSFRSLMAMSRGWDGWNVAQDIIWEKHNGSHLHADRFRRVHEIAVHLYRGQWGDIYKSPQYTMDAVAKTIRRKTRPPHLGVSGDSSYQSNDGGPRLMRSVLHVRSCHGSAVHPTEKPVDLLRPLIEYSCPPGGTILDPFAGSGSSGVAALSVYRQAILMEIDRAYIPVIERRIGAVQGTLPLKGAAS